MPLGPYVPPPSLPIHILEEMTTLSSLGLGGALGQGPLIGSPHYTVLAVYIP